MLSPFGRRGFYDPFSEMNRLFEEALGGIPARRAIARQGGTAASGAWTPAIDVVQDGGDLVVRAELPGAKPEDVEITVHNGVLTLSGSVQEGRQEERGGYLVRERRSGSFRRSLQLPQGVDENAISARFESGILEVTIRGAAAVQEPKRVEIEGGSEGGQDVEVAGEQRGSGAESAGAEGSGGEQQGPDGEQGSGQQGSGGQ